MRGGADEDVPANMTILDAAMRPVLIVAIALLAAAGCGQKGPLYLRDSPPPGVKPPKPEAYKPAPYPKEAAQDEAQGAKK
jgi:predicted small lipoprotein YifL